ncbi:bifunctional UDP-N-acetylglucosamine diphosphorylase/glucosamine-1-phosphate N-acetyltransferase GlmU [Leptothermofonsia sp. ETS-13]|uniref:bifunctional UDP-N-acetylglucosamine diphosphorylase/glucosamine-1-phosphate N-acetyltransferase GlmU n=1 Tax=Leptothermofonsia sp. ETS-13 TaxID=3035696 RepID=UPI003BA376F7
MVAVAILAAGKGTRMKSDLPKVLHQMGGRSLVEWVLNSLSELHLSRRLVIIGYRGNLVKEALTTLSNDDPALPELEFVEQPEQLGTGHAIQQLLPHLQGFQGDLLILNGDVPLLRPETLKLLLKTHREHQVPATILTAHMPNPKGYGRVFCNGQNILQQIVEDRDCSPAQKQNRRINAGVYCFRWPDLAKVLPKLTSDNEQREYYLTDAVNFLDPVMIMDVEDYQEILGINDRKQLAAAYDILQTRIKDQWMTAGVTLIDPDSTTIDDTVQLEPDVVIEPQTHLRGKTLIRSGSRIGPGSLIENSQIGKQVTVLYSVITNSTIADGSQIGPYAHFRGPVAVGSHCRIGSFVEIKNSTLGDKTNVAHLSYIGDATIGNQVNVGGGTITANYDGFKKHRTIIGDRTKTGVNNSLVAPITIGEDVIIGAGSTITEDVPDDCLALGRARQVIKPERGVKSRLKKSSDA